jgi:hypothetical protein
MNVCMIYGLPSRSPVVQADIESSHAQIAGESGPDFRNQCPDLTLSRSWEFEEAVHMLMRHDECMAVRNWVVIAECYGRIVIVCDAARRDRAKRAARLDLHRFSISRSVLFA